ncbi:MAG: aldolase/citrate lyase family protein [Anaerolineae bacterium]
MPFHNPIKAKFQTNQPVINAWLTFPDAVTAEVMAQAGYDSLTVDVQHGLMDYQGALAQIQALSAAHAPVMARVAWNEPSQIMKLLDAGALGIVCPMVNTRAEAEAFVGACRFAPQGYRSYGPSRMALYHGDSYFQNANAELLTIAMIETAQALDNVEAIVATPGLDAVYIGPSDLSISLGYPPNVEPTDPTLVAAIDRILRAAQQAGRAACLHCRTPEYAKAALARGFNLVTLNTDFGILRAASLALLEAVRS